MSSMGMSMAAAVYRSPHRGRKLIIGVVLVVWRGWRDHLDVRWEIILSERQRTYMRWERSRGWRLERRRDERFGGIK